MPAMLHDVETLDVEYQPGLLATIYRPRGVSDAPALLDLHGGRWVLGNRRNDAPMARALASRGILVASIDFRMPPQAGYPASIADAHLGIRWLKAHAADYGGRGESIGLIGSSSGGHMAALLGLRPSDPRYVALPGPAGFDGNIHFVVACWAILDPVARYEEAQARSLQDFVRAHNAYWGTLTAMEEGSPTRILERGEPVALPPVLIVQGTNDSNVMPPTMPDRFAAAYQARGGTVQLERFPDMVHGFINQQPDHHEAQRALQLIAAFVREHA